jgi:hypothetical protein
MASDRKADQLEIVALEKPVSMMHRKACDRASGCVSGALLTKSCKKCAENLLPLPGN